MLKKIYKVHYSFVGNGHALIEARNSVEALMKFEDNERVIADGERNTAFEDYKVNDIYEVDA